MKKKYVVICVIIIFLIAMTILVLGISTKKDEDFVDESKVRSIIMVNDLTGTAQEITNEEDICNICKTLNTMTVKIIREWEEFYSKIPDGNQSFQFYFRYDYGIEKEFGYAVGNGIISNGCIYETTSEELEQYWNLNYPKKKWRHHNFE